MHVTAIILQIVLGLVFLMAGFSKVSGAKQLVESFEHLKLPQWFRTITGLLQLVGVAALIAGIWVTNAAVFGGAWIAIIMFGAIVSHVRVKDSFAKMGAPIVLLILALLVVFFNLR
jgi:putative oxidoreductase